MKILVTRFSSIGDILLTTPVVRCLKKQLNCEVHFATKKAYVSLLEANPYIDKIIALEDSFSAFGKELKKEKYDWVIDLHHNLRTSRLKLALKTKSKSFDKLNRAKWIMVKQKRNVLPDIHIVDRYLETVKHLGIANDDQGLDYFLPTDFKTAITLPDKYQVYAIGGQHATKKMPIEKIIEVCNKVEGTMLLLGGKEDAEIGKKVAASCPNVLNYCGKSSLHESAWIIKGSQRVFTHDTGMMHIAAAYNKAIVSFWGNTIPEFGMYPYYKELEVPAGSKIMEVKGLPCRPCSKIGFDTCPKGHFNCMHLQDLTEIDG